jgi:hypothetical protein
MNITTKQSSASQAHPPMNRAPLTGELLAACEALALRVAPELAQRPLYAINTPIGFPSVGDTVAFTSGACNFMFRDALIAEGRWRGPGTAVAFCKAMEREVALGMMLHEIAHCLPFVDPPMDCATVPTMRIVQMELAASQLARPLGDSLDKPRWYKGHGFAFIRNCVHLHFRAWQLGFEIALPSLEFADSQYDLSPPWRYMRACGDEPRRMQAATFADIVAQNPPAEFRQLWLADFKAWRAVQQQRTNNPASMFLENERCQT